MLSRYLAVVLGSSSITTALLTTPPVKNCDLSLATNATLASYNATISNATLHSAATLNARDVLGRVFNNTFAFCELDGIISYGTNSSLRFSLYLPQEAVNYNGRFMAVGDGGMAGTIDRNALLTQLNAGFAVAGGDAGHTAATNNAGGGSPGVYLPYLHNPNEVEAWIHNAISLFTPAAKALTKSYYSLAPKYSYYTGCSTGGAQGFALAQYHPTMFDAIYAGSPGNWYSHLALSFLWNAQATASNASYLSQAVLNFTSAAVLAACDGLDGVMDGVIENPLACNFDVSTLACNASTAGNNTAAAPTCLTAAQVEALKSIYAGPVNSQTGAQLYPGFSFGSEIELLYQEGYLSNAFSVPILQNLVYNNLSYNASTFNWASDVADVDARAGVHIDEISANLTEFRKHGGQMIVTQGWSDTYNAAIWPIEHLEQIQSFYNGEDISDFFNLFMIPGGGHCGSASYYPTVPAYYHVVPALVRAVERGERPNTILSTESPDGVARSRKLCAWPSTARYVMGDVDDWNSYVCE